MKLLASLIFSGITFTSLALAHDHDSSHGEQKSTTKVDLVTDVDSLKAGPIILKVQLKQGQKSLGARDIEESHTQLVHAFLVDQTLTQFRHEHPEWDGKAWVLKTNLENGGSYKLWIQAKVKNGNEVTLSKALKVSGTPARAQGFLPKLQSEVDNVVVKLAGDAVKAGEQSTLKFSVSRKDGSPLKLESYLGAAAHVVAIHEKNDEMAHMHPLNEEAVSPFETHAAFEKPGNYRIWAQFKENGKLLTIPFTLQVAKGSSSKKQMDHSKH
ncbi:MAG: hypothetical protein J0L93_08435 [Deltaproteobacteria bacterium]|nr:hypothetical protein [Deltaproteobacteria bacterium]